MYSTRAAGSALAVYGVATALAFVVSEAPGGGYEDRIVSSFVSPDHTWSGFGLAYLGLAGALALLPFGLGMRERAGRARDLVWALALAATTLGLVGWFVIGGITVAMAEGGAPVRDHVPHAVVHLVSEIGVLLALCAPALCLGVGALVLARSAALPTWLRVFSVVAGICGILAPFYFTLMVFLLWTIVAGIAIAVPRVGVEPTLSGV